MSRAKDVVQDLNVRMGDPAGEVPELLVRSTGFYTDIVWCVDGLTIMDSEHDPDVPVGELEKSVVLAMMKKVRQLKSAVDRLMSVPVQLTAQLGPHARVNEDDTVTILVDDVTVTELEEILANAKGIIESGENKCL
jgi:hypothetical protein